MSESMRKKSSAKSDLERPVKLSGNGVEGPVTNDQKRQATVMAMAVGKAVQSYSHP